MQNSRTALHGLPGLRAHLAELDAQLENLDLIHRRQGDALAGKLRRRIEEERERVVRELEEGGPVR